MKININTKIGSWIYPLLLIGFTLFTIGSYQYSASAKQGTSTTNTIIASDVLPSWNNTPIKKNIINFVMQVTNPNSPDYVPPAERIATFDNDGTLWAEQPMAFQIFFIVDRIKALAPQHPEWKTKEPFASLLKGTDKTSNPININSLSSVMELMKATQAGISPEEFVKIAAEWLATAKHPTTNRLFTDMVYQPMLELLDYLRANEFKIYIVSGGSCDFIRAFSEKTYGVPPEQVIGSSLKTTFEINNGKPVIMSMPELNFSAAGNNKPIAIQDIIGRRPVASFGNSDNDQPMLQWTGAGAGARFCLYVHHTDAEREWSYDRVSADRFDKGLDEAVAKGWAIVDMKNDWKIIYPYEK